MVRILKLALWNLKLWFIVYNEHFVLVEIEIWSILDDDDDDDNDDDDEVFIEKSDSAEVSQKSWVIERICYFQHDIKSDRKE